MGDVEKVQGLGPKEPEKSERNIPSSKEFQKLMEQDKVSRTDEEQKKHGKRREKTEEEKSLTHALASQHISSSHVGSGQKTPPTMKGTRVETTSNVQPGEISEEEAAVLEKTAQPSSTPKVSGQPTTPSLTTQETPIGYHPPATINEEIAIVTGTPQPLPTPAVPSPDEAPIAIGKAKPTTGTEKVESTISPMPTQTPPPLPAAPPMVIQPYMQLTPEMLAVFEKMIGVMSVMNTSGITQTTIHLTSPQFASSLFYGAQIVIKEYSTAPRAYNIQILGSAKAVDYLQGKLTTLTTALQKGEYAFTVNRLETGLLKSDRVRVTRKKNVKDEESS